MMPLLEQRAYVKPNTCPEIILLQVVGYEKVMLEATTSGELEYVIEFGIIL
jgi:hypothetical protein